MFWFRYFMVFCFSPRPWSWQSRFSKVENLTFCWSFVTLITKSWSWSLPYSALWLQEIRVFSCAAKDTLWLSLFAFNWWLINLKLSLSFSKTKIVLCNSHFISLSLWYYYLFSSNAWDRILPMQISCVSAPLQFKVMIYWQFYTIPWQGRCIPEMESM